MGFNSAFKGLTRYC